MTETTFRLILFALLLLFSAGVLVFHLWHMEQDKRANERRRQHGFPAE